MSDPCLIGAEKLSMKPELRSLAISRLMVERLTCSRRAIPFQSGRTVLLVLSILLSRSHRICSPRSHGMIDGRPLGRPVAL